MVIVEVETPQQQKNIQDCVRLGKLLCEHGETLSTIIAHALVSYDHSILTLSTRVSTLQERGYNMTEEEKALDSMEDFKTVLLGFLDKIQ